MLLLQTVISQCYVRNMQQISIVALFLLKMELFRLYMSRFSSV